MACDRWWFSRCFVLVGFSLVIAESDSSYYRYDDLSRSQHSVDSQLHFSFTSDLEDDLVRRQRSSAPAKDAYSTDETGKASVVTPIVESSDENLYYDSNLIINETIGRSLWVDMDSLPDVKVNKMLQHSYKKAASVALSFDFPFYGDMLRKVAVATGGFLSTSYNVDRLFAETQYIAPLMANFDTRISDESSIRYLDNGTAFVVEWRKLVLEDNQNAGAFSFQATLHQNGDIVFVYSEVPIDLEDLQDEFSPVKVGLSDAYSVDQKDVLPSHKETISVYDELKFNRQNIKNWTVIYLHALPTCISMKNCNDCVTRSTLFDCKWCPSINRCSDGIDRHREEWLVNECESRNVKIAENCPSTETTRRDNEKTNATRDSLDLDSSYDYDLPTSYFKDNSVRRRRTPQRQLVASPIPPVLEGDNKGTNGTANNSMNQSSTTSTTVNPVTTVTIKSNQSTPIVSDPLDPKEETDKPATSKPSDSTDKSNKTLPAVASSTEKPKETTTIGGPMDDLTNNTLHENNITNSTNDTHQYYNSTFTVGEAVARSYWVNMDDHPSTKVNELLSESHRRAATVKLSFDFPFYGHKVRNVTVATGGFLYTGEYVHSWLAATQYIAPLMANFDTRMSNDSLIKYVDNGTSFTVEWEKVVLQEKVDAGAFTFQATLHKNGDIVFVYKQVPILIEDIKANLHPVKVGLSDAYIMDRTIIFVRRKTIYEYHRVNFDLQTIKNWTVIYLRALPTCVAMENCQDCTSHLTEFKCKWCPSINRCSTGVDRHTQEWSVKGCDDKNIDRIENCPSNATTTDNPGTEKGVDESSKPQASSEHHSDNMKSSVASVFGILVVVALIVGLVAWVAYAYRYPHSTSGQMLIRYRPSQWSWRRGEARYTAATIHM